MMWGSTRGGGLSVLWRTPFPELGQPGRELGTRELRVEGLPWIVVYRLRPDVIAVDRIIHGAMLWPPAEDG